MKPKSNLLQYEFFHVGGEGATLKNMLQQANEHTADNLPLALSGNDTGTGIKTVLRIYDTEGRVTHWAQEIIGLKAKCEFHINTPRSNLISDWWARWRIEQLNRYIERKKRLIVGYCIEYLEMSFRGEWQVAREILNHDFRPARSNEYMDLHLAATTAKGFWLFIFKPDNLLATENQEVILSLM